MTRQLSAAVLAGGLSSRMGKDKALLAMTSGGPSMLEIVLGRLRQIASDLLIVAPHSRGYDALGTRVVSDLSGGGGALAGIHAALVHAEQDYCFVAACDMPFLSAELLAYMADAPRDYDVLVPLLPGKSRQRSDGLVYQTLHAIYSKRCLLAIEEQLATEERKVVGFFDRVLIREMGTDEVIAVDPTLRSFFNANTPEALAQARSLLSSV
jgi:molybdopterin-guanine dinucleotide biosynthesis protein A